MTPLDFYAAVAPLTTAVLRLAPSITAALPRRWQWVPAVVIAGALEAVACAGLGKSWADVGLAGLLAALTAGPGAIGLHHALKRLAPPPPLPEEEIEVVWDDQVELINHAAKASRGA